MTEHHETLAPSSADAILACPRFRSGPAGEAAERGSRQHEYLAQLLSADPQRTKALGLTEDEREAVEWAAEYIQANRSAEVPLQIERRFALIGDDFAEKTFGTVDAYARPDLFDYKGGMERSYRAQMAFYALMAMDADGIESVTVHLLFGKSQTPRKYVLARADAEQLVMDVIRRREDETSLPTPCDYCGWCADAATCPPLCERAAAIAAGREDWKLEQYHTSDIAKPEEMAKALDLAEQMESWCESVRFHAKEMAIKEGVKIPGWKVQERQGNREVTDIPAAFGRAALPQEEFLRCCTVVLGKLEEAFAKFHGMKKAPAKRDLEGKLADCVVRKPTTLLLVREKAPKQEG